MGDYVKSYSWHGSTAPSSTMSHEPFGTFLITMQLSSLMTTPLHSFVSQTRP